MEFRVSFTHLSGLPAAVVNFNELPKFLTAVARRISLVTPWHFFDDQGVLEFSPVSDGKSVGCLGTEGRSKKDRSKLPAQDFTIQLFKLVGRPFTVQKHSWHRPRSRYT